MWHKNYSTNPNRFSLSSFFLADSKSSRTASRLACILAQLEPTPGCACCWSVVHLLRLLFPQHKDPHPPVGPPKSGRHADYPELGPLCHRPAFVPDYYCLALDATSGSLPLHHPPETGLDWVCPVLWHWVDAEIAPNCLQQRVCPCSQRTTKARGRDRGVHGDQDHAFG